MDGVVIRSFYESQAWQELPNPDYLLELPIHVYKAVKLIDQHGSRGIREESTRSAFRIRLSPFPSAKANTKHGTVNRGQRLDMDFGSWVILCNLLCSLRFTTTRERPISILTSYGKAP